MRLRPGVAGAHDVRAGPHRLGDLARPAVEHLGRKDVAVGEAARIHEIAGDFTVEDVWALPTPGGPDDLDRLVRQLAGGDRTGTPVPGAIPRLLFTLRWKLGALPGWHGPGSSVGSRGWQAGSA